MDDSGDNEIDERFDGEEIYCRKLGHFLTFNYCRREREEKPCSRIIACWGERIPIRDFLSAHFSTDEIDAFVTPPPGRMDSLLEIIERAKKRANTND